MPEEMMCCGKASLRDVDKEELSGGGKTPRKEKKAVTVPKEKKKPEVAKTKKKENPYASLGLDKFSTVLAELESRREKVLRRVDGGGDRVMVRFVQSGAKGWMPIVVKLPQEEPAAKGAEPKKKCKLRAAMSPAPTQPTTPRSTELASPPREDVKRASADAAKGEPKRKCKLSKSAVSPPLTQPSTPRSTECASPKEDFKRATAAAKATAVAAAPAKKKAAAVGRLYSWGKKKVTRPSQYWPFVAVLLLVSLVVFGRVFAICCTTVWWYLVPILSGGEEGQDVKTGRDLGKKSTDKKIGGKLTWASLPPSHGKKNSSGAHEVISPRSHAHGKKG